MRRLFFIRSLTALVIVKAQEDELRNDWEKALVLRCTERKRYDWGRRLEKLSENEIGADGPKNGNLHESQRDSWAGSRELERPGVWS